MAVLGRSAWIEDITTVLLLSACSARGEVMISFNSIVSILVLPKVAGCP